jgi:hypothetical protein
MELYPSNSKDKEAEDETLNPGLLTQSLLLFWYLLLSVCACLAGRMAVASMTIVKSS